MWRLRAGAGMGTHSQLPLHPATRPPGHARAHAHTWACALPQFHCSALVSIENIFTRRSAQQDTLAASATDFQRPLSAMGLLCPGGPVAARLCLLVVCSVGILYGVSDAAAVPPAPAVAAAPCSNGEPRVHFPRRERAINPPLSCSNVCHQLPLHCQGCLHAVQGEHSMLTAVPHNRCLQHSTALQAA